MSLRMNLKNSWRILTWRDICNTAEGTLSARHTITCCWLQTSWESSGRSVRCLQARRAMPELRAASGEFTRKAATSLLSLSRDRATSKAPSHTAVLESITHRSPVSLASIYQIVHTYMCREIVWGADRQMPRLTQLHTGCLWRREIHCWLTTMAACRWRDRIVQPAGAPPVAWRCCFRKRRHLGMCMEDCQPLTISSGYSTRTR